MFSNLKFWIAIFGIPILALLPDLTIKYMKQVFYPSPTDKVLLKMLNKKNKRKWWKFNFLSWNVDLANEKTY